MTTPKNQTAFKGQKRKKKEKRWNTWCGEIGLKIPLPLGKNPTSSCRIDPHRIEKVFRVFEELVSRNKKVVSL